MNITADIRYIGVNDRKIDLFEGQYAVPNGMSYNSYALLDEKVAKRMCTRKDVLEIVKEIKDRVEVLVTLGAGDLDNDVPQIAKILKNVTC